MEEDKNETRYSPVEFSVLGDCLLACLSRGSIKLLEVMQRSMPDWVVLMLYAD